jgi:GTP cyclohydrolase I
MALTYSAIDAKRIEEATREVLLAMGEDPDREGLRATPERVARMYSELFAGLLIEPADLLQISFDEGHEEMVIIRDIPFYSMCEHHLLPFHGRAHLGYIPRGKVTGLSKLARVVEAFAKRPQLQERLTSQIADTLMDHLEPEGVAVVIEAQHLCMTMRGVQKPGSSVVTSAVRGHFADSSVTRAEFLSLVRG